MSGRAPALAGYDDEGDRFYHWKGESFYSVTTEISGGVPKYALVPWAAKSVAELAYRDVLARGPHSRASAIVRRWTRAGRADVAERQGAGGLTSIKLEKQTDGELALRYLKGEPERIRDAAGAIGSDVHSHAEDLVLEHARESASLIIAGLDVRPWPAGLEGYQRSFLNWLEDFEPEFIASEFTVFNRPQAYAGTGDCLTRIRVAPGVVVIVDLKSGNYVYPEVGMQLAAYARGEFIGSPDRVTEIPMPVVERGAVLHLRPKATKAYLRGYGFQWVDIGDDVFRDFLYAREVFRWLKVRSRTVLGDVIEPIARAAA